MLIILGIGIVSYLGSVVLAVILHFSGVDSSTGPSGLIEVITGFIAYFGVLSAMGIGAIIWEDVDYGDIEESFKYVLNILFIFAFGCLVYFFYVKIFLALWGLIESNSLDLGNFWQQLRFSMCLATYFFVFPIWFIYILLCIMEPAFITTKDPFEHEAHRISSKKAVWYEVTTCFYIYFILNYHQQVIDWFLTLLPYKT